MCVRAIRIGRPEEKAESFLHGFVLMLCGHDDRLIVRHNAVRVINGALNSVAFGTPGTNICHSLGNEVSGELNKFIGAGVCGIVSNETCESLA